MPINPHNINTTTRSLLKKAKEGSGVRRLYLHLTQKKLPADYHSLAENITSDQQDHVFVPDTCFFTKHEIPGTFWQALMTKRIAITTPVFNELSDWRSTPHSNRNMASHVAAMTRDDGPPIVFADGCEWGSHWLLARQFYTTLLSSRKDRALELVAAFVRNNGRQPSSQELQQLLQVNGAERDLKLMLKAVDAGRSSNWWTDEDLVVSALQIGLISGTTTSVLTRDRDVFDQFERLCTLVTMNYQSYLFGEHFRVYGDEYERFLMPGDAITHTYFDTSESFMVRKPVPPEEFTSWLLPKTFHPVQISCVLFGGPPDAMTAEVLTYNTDCEISHLMRTKGKSLGKNTELPSGLNCHVTGFPATVQSPRDFVILAQDKWRTGPGTAMRWSELDWWHANFEDGQYFRLS